MTFVEAQLEYCRIKKQLTSNSISYEEFVEKVNSLRLQDNKGNWYQVDSGDGSWLWWDGQAWSVLSRPETVSKTDAASHFEKTESANKAGQEPESLLKLLSGIVKGFFRNFYKNIKFQLIKAGIIFLVVFLVHAWLLVVKNEGFAVDWNNPYAAITNLKGVNYFVPVFWALFALFVTVFLTRIIKGPVKFIKEIFTTPRFIISSLGVHGQTGSVTFLAAVAISLLSSIIIKNPYLLVLYSIMIILSLTKQRKSLLLLAVKLAWQDWYRIFRRDADRKANIGVMAIFLLGISMGLFLVYIIPLKPYSPFVLAVILLVLCVLLKTKKASPKAAMIILSFLVFNIVLFKYREVFADDGGWREAGGTLKSWVNSPGAGKAAADGIGPGAAAAGGSLAGTFIPEAEISEGETAEPGTTKANEAVSGCPEGTIVHKNPDGTVVEEYPDGTIIIKNPDGTVEEIDNGELPDTIFILPESTLGGPDDNPFTVFEGDNPCI